MKVHFKNEIHEVEGFSHGTVVVHRNGADELVSSLTLSYPFNAVITDSQEIVWIWEGGETYESAVKAAIEDLLKREPTFFHSFGDAVGGFWMMNNKGEPICHQDSTELTEWIFKISGEITRTNPF